MIALSAIGLLGSQVLEAKQTKSPLLPNFFKNYYVTALYSYRTFDYDSSQEGNFNRYHGHTNLYGLGGNNFEINESWTAGVFAFKTFTNVSSAVSLGAEPLSLAQQTIRADSIYGDLLRRVTDNFYVDFSAGRTDNKISYNNQLLYSASTQVSAGNNTGYNWFAMVSGYLAQVYKEFMVREDVRSMYSYAFQNAYKVNYSPFDFMQDVPLFSNRSLFFMEDIEVTWTKNMRWQPYVNAGLLQVARYKNSNNTQPIIAVGPIPEFNLDQNGYTLGGGLSYSNDPYTVRLDYMHFVRGSVFDSDQVTVSFRVKMD